MLSVENTDKREKRGTLVIGQESAYGAGVLHTSPHTVLRMPLGAVG